MRTRNGCSDGAAPKAPGPECNLGHARRWELSGALLATVLLLAFANGANDNPKGMATLIGCGSISRQRALVLASAATAVGSLGSAVWAPRLAAVFSRGGLLPSGSQGQPVLAAIALGAVVTILLATWRGLPVSTTHAIVGAFAGAALASGSNPRAAAPVLAGLFVPLAISPLIALVLAAGLRSAGRLLDARYGISQKLCICAGSQPVPAVPRTAATASARRTASAAPISAGQVSHLQVLRTITVSVATKVECRRRYSGRLVGIDAERVAEAIHTMSGLSVSLARGMNDTPKIVGLAALSGLLTPAQLTVAVTAAMACGGVFAARRVAQVMASGITPMEQGMGLAANLATSTLVGVASPLGLPLSTTHVATGAIAGVGALEASLRWRSLGEVAAAWVATLPVAALVAAAATHVLL
ncbi:MAG: anion permease [Candidatus Dadabacteria bacterium]|nr:MAG: anion permease [Candidatus Dadabacteria bacterium]